VRQCGLSEPAWRGMCCQRAVNEILGDPERVGRPRVGPLWGSPMGEVARGNLICR